MGVRFTLLLLGALSLGLSQTRAAEPTGKPEKTVSQPAKTVEAVTFAGHVKPFLAKYCISCHGGAKPKGDLALSEFRDENTLGQNPKVWREIVRMVREHEMPPAGRKIRPSAEEIERVTSWVNQRLKAAASGQRDPGRVTIRRLNRVEYNNTIRDLLGVDFQPADDFPADDVGYGFDNIGDVLSMPPILMEKYLAAAEKIVNQAFADPKTRDRVLDGQPKEKNVRSSAYKVLAPFATRAYRRPAAREEIRRLVEFVELADANRDGFETGIKLALQAILVSPHFLFRVELDADAGAVHAINDFELATRLSYFLWSSMPDQELFDLAKRGALRQGNNLESQVRRLLKDPKSRALVDNFAGQWLQIRNLKTVSPDTAQFPSFNEALRSDMRKETELFFEYVMREDRSVLDFLDADYTFLNERLAKHYGIPNVQGEQFRKVALTNSPRGGVLTQASILTITSNPTRTSPVKRGKWILENILGTPPPPPPPDVPELEENKKAMESGTLRQRMEQHRVNPSCATCHQRMDPLGFGFENFDAVGAWRDKDGSFRIDSTGELPGGKAFQGPKELKAVLKGRASEFRRCLTEKMLTYGLGRGLEDADQGVLDQIAADLAKKQNKFSALVVEIVKSDPFQKRRGQ